MAETKKGPFKMVVCDVKLGDHGVYAVCFPFKNGDPACDFLGYNPHTEHYDLAVTFTIHHSVLDIGPGTILDWLTENRFRGMVVYVSDLFSKRRGEGEVWSAHKAVVFVDDSTG